MLTQQRGDDANTATDAIAQRMREDIFNGVLAPGERLTIASLAERYGVSHLPVRQALRVVEGYRLVHILPRCGALVRSVDRKLVTNIYDCRGALDSLVAGQSVEKIGAEQVAQLARLAEQHKAALKAADAIRAFNANRNFHALIYRIAGNDDALRMVQGGWELVSSWRRQFGISDQRQSQAVEEHSELVQAYRDRNRGLVLALTIMHCELAKRDLLRQVDRAEAAVAS